MPDEPKTGLVFITDAVKCEYRDSSPMGRRPLTLALIGLNLTLFIASMDLVYPILWGHLRDPRVFEYLASPACVASGGCLPQVLLSMFLHAGLLHLAGNMIFLYIIGDNVEVALGWRRALLVYLASGIAGAAVQAIASLRDTEPALFMVGASAAVSGFLGAYLILYPGSTMCYCLGIPMIPLFYYCFRLKASNYIAIWLLIQTIILATVPYIAVWAHLAGLLTGLALARHLADRARIARLRIQFARGLYKGHRIDRAELRQPSLSPLAQILVIASAAIVLVGLAASVPTALGLEGKYYNVYMDVTVAEHRLAGQIYVIRDVEVRVEDSPPQGFYLAYKELKPRATPGVSVEVLAGRGDSRNLVPLARAEIAAASYHMEHVSWMAYATLALGLASSLAALHAALYRPEEVEVTYIGGLDGEDL